MKLQLQVLATIFTLAASLSFANTDFTAKVVGGVEATAGEFPFIVSLQDSRQGHFCGGSLIRKNWVLTAAHCTAGNIDAVVIGLHDRFNSRNAETIRPQRVIVHPKFDENTMDYDFALIELSQDSRFQPIDLNTAELNIPSSGSSIMATVAGWGTTRESGMLLPARLQKVDVPLISQSSCNQSYRGAITDRMLCAGYENGGKDSCQGDSGGPLVAQASNNQKYLIGVVSWGEGCARAHSPGVYSKVSEANSWISQTAL